MDPSSIELGRRTISDHSWPMSPPSEHRASTPPPPCGMNKLSRNRLDLTAARCVEASLREAMTLPPCSPTGKEGKRGREGREPWGSSSSASAAKRLTISCSLAGALHCQICQTHAREQEPPFPRFFAARVYGVSPTVWVFRLTPYRLTPYFELC